MVPKLLDTLLRLFFQLTEGCFEFNLRFISSIQSGVDLIKVLLQLSRIDGT